MGAFENQIADVDSSIETQDTQDASPEIETLEPYQPEETEEPQREEGQREEIRESEEREESAPEKPMLPAQLSKALREMREAHPEHAQALKELQSSYFNKNSYAKIFPSTEEAIEAKSMLEAIGGKEGMVNFQRQRELIHEYDRQVDEGDPEIIKWMADASPDGFKKLVPQAMKTLERMDPDSFDEIIQPIINQHLDYFGIRRTIEAVINELNAGETARANTYIQQLKQWSDQHKQIAQQRETRYRDPRVQQLESREKSLSEEKHHMVESHVDRDINYYLQSKVPEALRRIGASVKLPQQAKEDLIDGIYAEIERNLDADEFYKESKHSMIRQAVPTGNIDPAVKFAKAQIDKILDRSVNSVWNRRYGAAQFTKNTVQRPSQSSSNINSRQGAPTRTSSGPLLVARRPDISEFDQKRTTQEMFLSKLGYLKNGRYITWKRS